MAGGTRRNPGSGGTAYGIFLWRGQPLSGNREWDMHFYYGAGTMGEKRLIPYEYAGYR